MSLLPSIEYIIKIFSFIIIFDMIHVSLKNIGI